MKTNFSRNVGFIPTRKPSKKTVKRLFSYFLEYKSKLFLVFLFVIISAFTTVIGAMFLEILIDKYIPPLMSQSPGAYNDLFNAILFMGIIYIAGVISTLFYNLIMINIEQGILKKIRDDMFIHMEKLPISFFDTHAFGDIMSHYTNDTDTLRQMIGQSIPQSLYALVSITAVFFAMMYTSLYLTFFVVIALLFMLYFLKVIGGKSAGHFMQQQETLGKVNGYIEEMITGQKVIKVFSHEQTAKENFNQLNDKLCEDATQANTFANILMPIMGNLGNLQYILIVIIGGILVIYNIGGLTIGVIAAFLQLSRNFVMPITNVSQQINYIIMALAGAERIFKFMDEEVETDTGYVNLVNASFDNDKLIETTKHTGIWAWKQPFDDGVKYTQLLGDVKFNDVDFGYKKNNLVLHDINLYAKPGEKIAFVGPTGAGKTTITNLINRFYDINDGNIFYDGININIIKKEDLRSSLGMVLQDVSLFTGTVMDNIRYGKLDATDQECIDAAKCANAHKFISMLPDGYNTVISGNTSDLSQGQRQLISIARAAVADPPVMILDEATSSIDTRTELIVQKGMDALMHGRTVLVIAHRLSTVQNSDVIMVIDNGKIIERGSHEQLISLKGKYYELYTGVFELE